MARFNVDHFEAIDKKDAPAMTKEQANNLLSDKLEQARALISECEALADKYQLEFSMDIAYGMGGYYEEGEWNPSSQSC